MTVLLRGYSLVDKVIRQHVMEQKPRIRNLFVELAEAYGWWRPQNGAEGLGEGQQRHGEGIWGEGHWGGVYQCLERDPGTVIVAARPTISKRNADTDKRLAAVVG